MTDPLSGDSLQAALTVQDLDRSVGWYRQALGFTVERRHEREGIPFAVSLRAGTVRLLVSQDNGARGLERTKGEGISLQISTVRSVDEIAARIRQAGSTLETEPTTMPWGVRMLRVRDPDGFRFTISTTSV